MTDIEKRAHDLAVAYVTQAYIQRNSEFKFDQTEPFEFGTAYEVVYHAIIKSIEEKFAPEA